MATDDLIRPLDRLLLDADADGQVDVAELWSWCGTLFFLPGDSLIYALAVYLTPLAEFLGLDTADYGGVVSAFVSVSVWLVGFMFVSITYHYVRDLDRRLTQALKWRFDGLLVRLRIARAVLRQRWRAWFAARVPANRTEAVENVDLSTTQLRVLRLHAELTAGYSLAVRDVARALGSRVGIVQDQLDELKRLGLLNRSVGGPDGESAYTLSAAGRALLLFRQLRRGDSG